MAGSTKQTKEIGRGGLGQSIGVDAFQACDFLGDMPDQGRMIQLSAMRDGCQIGSIGLDEYPVKWDETCYFLDLQRVLEGDDA